VIALDELKKPHRRGVDGPSKVHFDPQLTNLRIHEGKDTQHEVINRSQELYVKLTCL
jgi:hypothetical protein